MTDVSFDVPQDVEKVETEYRKIVTQIPNPESLKIINELKKYESRSMHGQLPVVWDRAKDFQVWDKSGNCWIDFTSTIFVANTGHSNSKVKAAIHDILDKDLMHSYTYATEIRAKYLKRLIEFMPRKLEKAFLLSSGTEVTECAIKLLRMHAKAKGKSRGGIISFEDSMHGRTMGAQMIGGKAEKRRWIGFQDPNVYLFRFPYPWALKDNNGNKITGKQMFQEDVEKLISKGVDFDKDIAGFVCEAYIGWGAIFFPKDYMQELARFCNEHNIILCLDEIQGGFARTGKLFVHEHYDIEPDLVCCGKGIGSGFPLSAVLGRADIMDIPDIGSMSSTHSANPTCCAAGLATIEEIEEKNLIKESERKGKILHTRLNEIKNKYPDRISHVLGAGLLAGILFKDPKTNEPDSDFPTKVCINAMQKGLLLVHTGRESIKIGPPLTITDSALNEGIDVFESCIRKFDGDNR